MFEIQCCLVRRQNKFCCECLLINLEEGKSAEILTIGMKFAILFIYLCCKNLQLRSNSCSRFLQLSGTMPSVCTGSLILQTWQCHSPHGSVFEKVAGSRVASFQILHLLHIHFISCTFSPYTALTHTLSKTVGSSKDTSKTFESQLRFCL